MISKNDFVLANWGNFVTRKDVSELQREEILKLIEMFGAVYEKINEVAPESKVLKVVK